MSDSSQSIAIFDFDQTLTTSDSFWTFLALVAGWPQVVFAFAAALAVFAQRHFVQQENRDRVDRGTFFKQQLLTRLIAGRSVESFREPAARLRGSLAWNAEIRRALQEHYAKGHHVVIASGSLDLYLPELIRDLPHHALLCTEIGVKDGVATDVMTLGNCTRQGKATRIAAYLKAHGPFGESWGYGNYPDDVPMLELLKHRIIVR